MGSHGLPHCFGDANSLCIYCVTKGQSKLKQGMQAERFSLWCGTGLDATGDCLCDLYTDPQRECHCTPQ